MDSPWAGSAPCRLKLGWENRSAIIGGLTRSPCQKVSFLGLQPAYHASLFRQLINEQKLNFKKKGTFKLTTLHYYNGKLNQQIIH